MTNHGLDVEEKFWADMSDAIIDSMETITGMDTDDLSDAEYLAVSGAILEVVKSALMLVQYEEESEELPENVN
ncbi:MAG: hypothetical protein KGL39_44350 [Patescibacteria group bacterium]|nr:hypothetical protein [Patescibacteria group bacterium]